MGGLEKLFEYIKKLSSNKILDIGTGNGNAISEISQMPISQGFDIEVTAIRNSNELMGNIDKDRRHITNIERLRGFDGKKFSCILGCNSIGYSTNPKLAIQKLDEILIPGGVIKATFSPSNASEIESYKGISFNKPQKFIDELKRIGYDVAYIDLFFFTTEDQRLVNSTVLAIKPGNFDSPSANLLLKTDLGLMEKKAVSNIFGINTFDIK